MLLSSDIWGPHYWFVIHTIALTYPLNPNGSPEGITGLTSRDGRATIMMPHPERVFRSQQLSWKSSKWKEYSPWMQIFINAYKFTQET